MADAAHWYGDDLVLAANGDLLLADGVDLSNQRVVRRLMTIAGGYVWHMDYGGSVPQRVGGLEGATDEEEPESNFEAVRAVARTQMYLEEAVSKSPEPQLEVQEIADGVFVSIRYTEALSGKNASLDFDVVI